MYFQSLAEITRLPPSTGEKSGEPGLSLQPLQGRKTSFSLIYAASCLLGGLLPLPPQGGRAACLVPTEGWREHGDGQSRMGPQLRVKSPAPPAQSCPGDKCPGAALTCVRGPGHPAGADHCPGVWQGAGKHFLPSLLISLCAGRAWWPSAVAGLSLPYPSCVLPVGTWVLHSGEGQLYVFLSHC